MRIIQFAAAAVAISIFGFSTAALGEPLKPLQPWVVNYAATECNAQREYGDSADPIYLGLVPSAWGNTFELFVATKGLGPQSAEELEGSVDFGHGPVKAWLLHYGTYKPKRLNFYRFRISTGEIAQATSAALVTFHVKNHPDFVFTLEVIPELLKTLHACTTDLQRYWNMTRDEQKNIAAPAVGEVRSVFSPSDYPDEAMSRGQVGRVQFLLLIDEQGKVAACDVLSPSGIPALDGRGCQVIRERARFKPAMGRDGKSVRSSYVTPPVVWLMK